MTKFPKPKKRLSQCDRILNVLLRNAGEFVPMPRLAKAASRTGIGTAVHSRISELRHKYGLTILTRRRWVAGQRRTAYMFASE
jgi:hypothetical protein